MQRRTRVFAAATAVLLVGSLATLTVSAGAVTSPPSLTIGVDHASPPGHNWQYIDFFPRSGLTVHQGEVVFDGGVQLHPVHVERAVAGDHDRAMRTVGGVAAGERGPDARAEGVSHAAHPEGDDESSVLGHP